MNPGLHVHGPLGPVVAQLGGSVLLPCFIESPLPLEGLQVEWRKKDSDSLVSLFQQGESRLDLQSQVFKGRVDLFPDKISKGNFSILLKNVLEEDAGGYRCKVNTSQDSSEVIMEVRNIKHLVVTGPERAIFATAGKDVVLNCSVDPHVPASEIEEVTWKKMDREKESDISVLLYQDKKIFPDSSHESYQDRVNFFSSEILKGNFSLKLMNVRMEDKGEFMCEVHTRNMSGRTTVVLQRIGFSALLVAILVLCSVALLLSVGLCLPAFHNLRRKVTNRKCMTMYALLILCPNICVCVAFGLWSAEGIFSEVVVCSAVSIGRPIMLMKTAPYLHGLPERVQKAVKSLAVPLYYSILAVATCSVFFDKLLQAQTAYEHMITLMAVVIAVSVISAVIFGLHIAVASVFVISYSLLDISFFVLIGLIIKDFAKDLCCIVIVSFLIVAIGVLCLHFATEAMEHKKDRAGYVALVVLLHVLAAMSLFKHPKHSPEFLHIMIYMFGSVGLVVVNSLVLVVELFLKAGKGARTVGDLRVIVLPFETAFVLAWLALLIYDDWGLVVTGSDRAVFAFRGEDVTLNCSVDSHVPASEIEEVTWKRTDRDPEILVLLYQDSEIFPDSSHESYQDRVDLFSSEIPKGNFSLNLKDVKMEDKGEFTCEIHTRNMSGRTTVLLQGVGFTTSHIAILVLCSVTLLLAVGFCGPVFNLLRKKDFLHIMIYMFGAVGLSSLNAIVLSTELILKAALMKQQPSEYRGNMADVVIVGGGVNKDIINVGKGARTIGDLRVIVLPLETVYFFAWLALQIYDSWGLVVTGSDRAVFASEGEDVTLNCSVDPHVPASEIEEVTWKRTDRDPEILVLLYQDSEIFPDSSHESYQDRVDLFFSEIPKGNFSLNLKDVKMEDKGEFTCEVHTRNMSGRTTVLLQGVGNVPL
ncbi:hypothetical protein QTP70_024292 [Hemibagrus guttatus]|uniref:Ig-like domain-containing protein n=1 Tax=Hemibagrus guttatus TaxID=175788 RepID=A0AAE0RI40_9TELE|nr:hypothetical protein QTP70_024292 [Hemibagrus guttatus]